MNLGRCGICKFEWTAMGQAHCATCHTQFNSDAAFDRHRKDFKCIPVEDFGKLMLRRDGTPGQPLLVLTERGVWATARRDMVTASESGL